MKKISDIVTKTPATWFLISIISIQAFLHLPFFSLPPMGQHVWRQVMGLSVAKNYFEEDQSFMRPSQDIRVGLADDGAIYTELPWFYWLLGQSYHITGFSHLSSRLLAFVFAALLLWGCYRLMRALRFSEEMSRWFVVFMAFTPFFYYYSITLLPNLPSLGLFLWGVALIKGQLEKERYGALYLLGLLLLTIATVTKQLYLFYGIPLAYIFWQQFRDSKKIGVLVAGCLSGLFLLGSNYILYRYGADLNAQAPWERSSTVQLHDEAFPQSWDRISTILSAFLTKWFAEMYISLAALPLFFVGCYQGLKNRAWKHRLAGFWLCWIASFCCLSFSFFLKFEEHGYYLTSISVLAALGSSAGICHLLQSPRGRKVAALCVVFLPVVMIGRVYKRWTDSTQVPEELIESSASFQQFIPKGKQVLVHGDATPVVYLYFLERKGLSLDLDTISPNKLREYQRQGFEYVVSETDPNQLKGLHGTSYVNLTRIGNFYLFKLNPNA